MPVYLDVVMLLNFLVDFFLLIGTNRLSGYPAGLARAAGAAALGGIYGGTCMVPGFRFLGSTLWRVVFLGMMGVVAFGLNRSTLRRCVLFVLLSMALGGIVLGFGSNSFFALIGAAGCVAGLCVVGFRGKADGKRYIPVILEYEGRRVRLTALHDTGNTLRDPLTGEPVLVADGKTAELLINLKADDLKDPVAAMGSRPGLRLIPYRAVGNDNGLMLCLRVKHARVDSREQSVLVAFAPEGLGGNSEYEALIGGT